MFLKRTLRHRLRCPRDRIGEIEIVNRGRQWHTAEAAAPRLNWRFQCVHARRTRRITKSGEDVILAWSTATETSSTQFDVQTAVDSTFETIGFVEAAGTSTNVRRYSYTIRDVEPGDHSFRLRHIDTEGTATYSDEINIELAMMDTYALSEVYPNPFNPQASFTLMVRDQQQVDVDVFNLLGRRVMSLYSGELEPGSRQTIRIDGANLSSGVYLVRVVAEQFTETRKITLLK